MPEQGGAAHLAGPTQLGFLICLMVLGVMIHPIPCSLGTPMVAPLGMLLLFSH